MFESIAERAGGHLAPLFQENKTTLKNIKKTENKTGKQKYRVSFLFNLFCECVRDIGIARRLHNAGS